MAQVAIVRVGEEYLREYAVEPGDVLIRICLRFGHTDWLAVYEHPANAAFRARFPDPDQIDFVNPVNLFVPLAGAATSGRSRRGRPLGDSLIARITWEDGTTFADEPLTLLGPGLPDAGRPVTTSAAGDVIVANPAAGEWSLVSPTVHLRAAAATGPVDPRDLDVSLPVAADPVPLTRNGVDTLVARSVVALRCPLCATVFAVTAQTPAGTGHTCPYDGFDWSVIVTALADDLITFETSPWPPQDPIATPAGLVCRGEDPAGLATRYGTVRVFWDESRFVDPAGADYTLFGRDALGVPRTAEVVGRGRWGAAAPRPSADPAAPRLYSFHTTPTGASAIYTFPVPNNESTPLASTLHWITIHHTTDPPQNSFATATALQAKHFADIGGTGPGADIAYHFVVDADGAVYEARPVGIKGSHAELFNGGNVGIVLAGNFEYIRTPAETIPGTGIELPEIVVADPPNVPGQPQLDALNNLVDVLALRFGIASAWAHQNRKAQAGAGHTYCPGVNVLPHIPPIRARYPGPPP